MITDHEEKCFDRLLKQADWPQMPSDLSEKIMMRINNMPEHEFNFSKNAMLQVVHMVDQTAFLLAAMVTLFCVGILVHSTIYTGRSLPKGFAVSYYAGPGLYLYKEFGS